MFRRQLAEQLRPAIVVTLALMVITGIAYPALVTGIAQIAFPWQANGSLVTDSKGHVTGSELIGQSFNRPEYFHPRPSAAGSGYDDTLSAGVNKGPTDRKLADTLIGQAVDSVVKNDGAVRGQVPSDMVTSSGSGLDPDISPASADLQTGRVARLRGIDTAVIRAMVQRHTKRRQFGVLGDPRVNVLLLNRALDSAFGATAHK
jgi:K+-transporting ATPase ATPase C chain